MGCVVARPSLVTADDQIASVIRCTRQPGVSESVFTESVSDINDRSRVFWYPTKAMNGGAIACCMYEGVVHHCVDIF